MRRGNRCPEVDILLTRRVVDSGLPEGLAGSQSPLNQKGRTTEEEEDVLSNGFTM